jgi:DNA-binding NarL/FixJ family response regulator
MTRVLLVDDHAIVRAGLRRLLAGAGEVSITEAGDAPAALAAIRAARPDLIILDLNLPGLGGIMLLQRILHIDPAARVLVLTMHAEALYAARALEAGARGYVSKNITPEEMLIAVRRVAAGARYVEAEIAQAIALRSPTGAHPFQVLSERELEIMRLLAEGRSFQQIADAMGIAYKTVANACGAIKAKLGVARTADLVRLAAHADGLAAALSPTRAPSRD